MASRGEASQWAAHGGWLAAIDNAGMACAAPVTA
jgi:hypothetical protein